MTVERLTVDGYDEVYRLEHAGVVAFVALHAVLAGRSFGGMRFRRYAHERAALEDALALARAMSRKVVLAGIDGGGGKTVVLEGDGDRIAMVARLGAFIEQLGGRYYTGGDYGCGARDLATLQQQTEYVACGDLSVPTAQSVKRCIDGVCAPSSVAIQGLGSVGRPLAEALVAQGVTVIASDPLVRVAGVRSVPPDAIYDVEVDVFAPCAMGGVLDERTVGRLRCELVCGAANNPFSSDADAERLRDRGIEYVPDVIANSGATIVGASRAVGEEAHIETRMKRVIGTAREVLARARREQRSPHAVAAMLADERIAALRQS